MAEFQYKGIDKDGKTVFGRIEAPNEGELRIRLRSKGVRPNKIEKVGALNMDLGALLTGGGVPNPVITTATRQLQVLLGSGVPLIQALEVLSEQTANKTMKECLMVCKSRVAEGAFLWEAISTYPKIFPKLYISLVQAGESSGALDQMLDRLTKYMENSYKLQKKVKGAMIYPAIMLLVGIGVIMIMLGFVIPRFKALLDSGGQKLPAPTQFVVDMSQFVQKFGYIIFPTFIIGGFLLFRYVQTPEGKAAMDRAFFKAPLFGPLMQHSGVARFSRTMNTLLAAGVNLIDAIDICKATVDNAVLEESIAKIRPQIESGRTLGSVVKELGIFPNMAVQMMAVGESTGNLDKMLEKIADFYEAEVAELVDNLTKMIEPLMLVFLGGTVGGFLIAMYLPIFTMANSVGG